MNMDAGSCVSASPQVLACTEVLNIYNVAPSGELHDMATWFNFNK